MDSLVLKFGVTKKDRDIKKSKLEDTLSKYHSGQNFELYTMFFTDIFVYDNEGALFKEICKTQICEHFGGEILELIKPCGWFKFPDLKSFKKAKSYIYNLQYIMTETQSVINSQHTRLANVLRTRLNVPDEAKNKEVMKYVLCSIDSIEHIDYKYRIVSQTIDN